MTILVTFNKSTGKFHARYAQNPSEEGQGNSLYQAIDNLDSRLEKVAKLTAIYVTIADDQRQLLLVQ